MSWYRKGFQEYSYLCQPSIMTQRKSRRSYHDMNVSYNTQNQKYVVVKEKQGLKWPFPSYHKMVGVSAGTEFTSQVKIK